MEIPRKKRNLILTALMTGSFMAAIDQSLLSSALSSIMSEFNISTVLGQWLTTGYLLILGVVTCTTAYLINQCNTKILFLSSLGVFGFGCCIAIIAQNFYILLAARAIQACGAGVLMPLLQSVTLYLFPKEKFGHAMGLIGLVVGFAPAIGPTVSGILVDIWGWRSIFIFLLIFTVIAGIVGWLTLLDFKQPSADEKLDIISIVLYGVGFCGFMLGITNIEEYGFTSLKSLLPLIIGIVCLIVFIRKQLQMKQPMLKLKIFRDKTFSISCIMVCITFIELMALALLVPLYIQSVRGMSATVSGLLMLPGSIILALLCPVAGKILDKYGARMITIIGMLILLIGVAGFVFLDESTTKVMICLMYIISMVGIALFMMPMTAYGVSNLSKNEISHGTAIITSIRQMAGSVGTSIMAVLVAAYSSNSLVDIHGINISFEIQSAVVVVGLFLAVVFVKQRDANVDN